MKTDSRRRSALGNDTALVQEIPDVGGQLVGCGLCDQGPSSRPELNPVNRGTIQAHGRDTYRKRETVGSRCV